MQMNIRNEEQITVLCESYLMKEKKNEVIMMIMKKKKKKKMNRRKKREKIRNKKKSLYLKENHFQWHFHSLTSFGLFISKVWLFG